MQHIILQILFCNTLLRPKSPVGPVKCNLILTFAKAQDYLARWYAGKPAGLRKGGMVNAQQGSISGYIRKIMQLLGLY